MAEAWKLTAFGPKGAIEAALVAQEALPDWDDSIGLAGFEVSEEKPDEWRLDAYLPRKPSAADRRAIGGLFAADPPRFTLERLPDADWVTESQKGMAPIRAGRFHVRTPDHPADHEAVDLVIPASQAFGTGQHATTAGCLMMLERMRREGLVVRNLADIGTGTGLLAFAALKLWPSAFATASDIDPVCAGVVEDNARTNHVPLGAGRGALLMTVADGMAAPVLQARAPYDLLIANILARPLIALAPAFARAVLPGGSVLLAGLLVEQEGEVRRACRRAGFRLARRLVRGDWAILWLRRR
ncbi:50S ribosomal protein L11 methyltransferase [Qipengyuania sediminis]|uniref:50S ribosomal protein L11 methyltransferase n=1 Tax=Qipengyuania sediminis TaxID=1532023 RepID=UPI001F0E09FF|nr:50S ribosomal protein L11 methyltransferase [Qipengyuania sediminis]